MGCASSVEGHAPEIHEQYSFHKKLGQGAFGQVRSCLRVDTGEEYAVKIINVEGHRSHRCEARLEGQIWKRLGMHPNVTGLVETFEDKSFAYFVMEKCHHSLYDMLLQKQRLRETDLLNTFQQMLLSLEHCHSKSVVHRDVKPANFLVTSNGMIKLCDFGLATLEDPLQQLTGLVGTAPFMSPEMVLDKPYTTKTDVWSVGAAAYLMLYGDYLYNINETRRLNPVMLKGKTSSQIMHSAIATNTPPPNYEPQKDLRKPSSLARSFVETLLRRDPRMRPSAAQCLQLSAMQSCPDDNRVADQHSSSTEATPSQSLSPIIKLAQQRTAELKTKVDPTVAKSMDELLLQLQQKHRDFPLRSFSLPDHNGRKSQAPSFHVKDSRSSTHGGELSISGLKMGDDLSESSTTASSWSTPSELGKITVTV